MYCTVMFARKRTSLYLKVVSRRELNVSFYVFTPRFALENGKYAEKYLFIFVLLYIEQVLTYF